MQFLDPICIRYSFVGCIQTAVNMSDNSIRFFSFPNKINPNYNMIYLKIKKLKLPFSASVKAHVWS